MTNTEKINELGNLVDANLDKFRDVLTDITAQLWLKGYRRVETTENISKVADCDQFHCKNCGILLEGWYRIEVDDDDGEEYHYEYSMKYCPECGAKIEVSKE